VKKKTASCQMRFIMESGSDERNENTNYLTEICTKNREREFVDHAAIDSRQFWVGFVNVLRFEQWTRSNF
jgi:hypothetical protein